MGDEDKQFEASQQKLQKARKEGQVVKSKDFSTAVAMLGVKSVIECFLYSQPFVIRTANNIYAFIADVVILMISIPICYKMHPLVEKHINNK